MKHLRLMTCVCFLLTLGCQTTNPPQRHGIEVENLPEHNAAPSPGSNEQAHLPPEQQDAIRVAREHLIQVHGSDAHWLDEQNVVQITPQADGQWLVIFRFTPDMPR